MYYCIIFISVAHSENEISAQCLQVKENSECFLR